MDIRYETERITARPWEYRDVDDMFAYAKDPDVGPAAGWRPHGSIDDSFGILRGFVEKPHEVCALVLKETGRVVGSLGLHFDDKRDAAFREDTRMLGYVLAKPQWGKGLMTEAVRGALRFSFDEMGIKFVSVYHFPSNDRSRRVIEKCGFRYDGRLRRSLLRFDGAVLDELLYSMTREEFYSVYMTH